MKRILLIFIAFSLIGCGVVYRSLHDSTPQKYLQQEPPPTGYVIYREGKEVVTDLGLNSDARRGDTLVVFNIDSEIRHPVTGKLIRVRLVPLGVIHLEEVGNISSSGKIVSGENKIEVGQFARVVSKRRIPTEPWWEEGIWSSSLKSGQVTRIPETSLSRNIIHIPVDKPTIQAGIDAAVDGDTVLVADGTYKGDGNKNLDFKGKAIAVMSAHGAENCIIDCEGDGRGFYFHSGEGLDSVVDGFTITNGSAEGGGGIACHNSSPLITNNILTGNTATDRGGGIYCLNDSSPTIKNNTFDTNSAAVGGGIDCRTRSNATITNNIISKNSATQHGGGINCLESNAIITNNILVGNSSKQGGGGGICSEYFAKPIIVNNTIFANTATSGGGIHCFSSAPAIVTNCIIWANKPNEILVGGTITITHSDIQGGWEGEGNINADPLFVDADNGDYHLSDKSPCIGAGIMTPDVTDADIEGNPRPNPPGSNPDMGVYENPLLQKRSP